MPVKTFTHKGHEYKLPARHYSFRRQDACFFYGGEFSNFVGGPFEIRDYDGIRYLAGELADDNSIPHYSHRKALARTHLRSYATIEHYFQANKAKTREAHDYIADQPGPWEAKKAGRSTELREDWEEIKFGVMMAALRVKFSEREFAAVLLGTHDRFIAEDSPTDFVWGIRDENGGVTGDNLLGKALMSIRDELRACQTGLSRRLEQDVDEYGERLAEMYQNPKP